MSEPFLGELKLVGFNFAPRGWAFCDGQLLPIAQNQALFSLMGTTYGGDGHTTFALPDLRGRAAMHAGPGYPLGLSTGEETVALTQQQLPAHSHELRGSSLPGDQPIPSVLAGANNLYGPALDLTGLAPAALDEAGTSAAHENRQPYLVLAWCIALQGLFPSHN